MPRVVAAAPAVEENHSQVVKAQLQLREMILAGEMVAGERISELVLAERLGISRTPIRAALMRLEQEGMLEATAGGRLKKGLSPSAGRIPNPACRPGAAKTRVWATILS